MASDKVAGRRSAAVPAASSGSVPLPNSSGRLSRDSDSRTGTVRELAGADACATGSSDFLTGPAVPGTLLTLYSSFLNFFTNRRASQSGTAPRMPKEQSISRHQHGTPRSAPNVSA